MEIIERKGFRIVIEDKDNQYVLITDDNHINARKFMLDHGYSKIQLNFTAGFRQESTEFLKNYDFVDGIIIMPLHNMNISGIHHLKNLRSLIINELVKHPLFFGEFPLLEDCRISWHHKNEGLETCKYLRHLVVRGYKKQDLSELANLTQLKYLKVKSSVLQSLSGIESLNLQYLGLVYCPKMTSLDLMPKTINILNLESCKNINNINQVIQLDHLETFQLNNCGDIESIEIIKQLKRLKKLEFWGNTNILDGDTAPGIGIKSVAFDNRKHYNYTYEQIKEINSALVR